MAFIVNVSSEFKEWFEEHGPQLSRPHADTLKGSTLKNLKELRIQYNGEPYRILYAFDPKRQALLLIAGNKATNKRWYEKMIPVAEEIFEKHLADLTKEVDDDNSSSE